MPPFLLRRFFPSGEPRHIGFLNCNRRLLAMGAVFASGTLTSIYAMPANAEIAYEGARVLISQSYIAPPISMPAVVRDGFGITTFTPVQWPVPSSTPMSSAFGYRSCAGCSSDHKGIDLNPGDGYPIQAIADGVVVTAEESGALGAHVIIEHTVDGQLVRSVYAHMRSGSITVSVGQSVARGQQVGQVGNTGLSTGPHLHFGIMVDGSEIDPVPWLLANVNS